MECANVDTTETITHVGLCAGYGGIELGLKRVLPTLRTVALCEIEAFAIANLVAKMEAGLMDAVPIWTDLKTFPWESFRDRVDVLTGGYPCQPFSAAGKRLGTEDERHLWPHIAKGIAILKPRVCLFENVEGHITLGLSTVVSDLEEMGYKVSWGIFSASECGAFHQRKRVWVMAHDQSERVQGLWAAWKQEPQAHEQQKLPVRSSPGADWTDGTTEPILLRMDDGNPHWVDRMRLLGNGVVPACAALAFTTLLNEQRNTRHLFGDAS
jgi:site-specific DNA-cytosine methylase